MAAQHERSENPPFPHIGSLNPTEPMGVREDGNVGPTVGIDFTDAPQQEPIASRNDTLLNWMRETIADPTSSQALQLRSDMVRTHEPFVESLWASEEPINAYRAINRYGEENRWGSIAPVVSAFVAILPSRLTPVEREIAGVGGMILSTMPTDERPQAITTHLYEAAIRNQWAEEFGSEEDWLTSVGTVVWLDGRQEEAARKDAVLESNVKILLETLENGALPIDFDLISRLYRDVILQVYPGASGPISTLQERSPMYEVMESLSGTDSELLYRFMGRNANDCSGPIHPIQLVRSFFNL